MILVLLITITPLGNDRKIMEHQFLLSKSQWTRLMRSWKNSTRRKDLRPVVQLCCRCCGLRGLLRQWRPALDPNMVRCVCEVDRVYHGLSMLNSIILTGPWLGYVQWPAWQATPFLAFSHSRGFDLFTSWIWTSQASPSFNRDQLNQHVFVGVDVVIFLPWIHGP